MQIQEKDARELAMKLIEPMEKLLESHDILIPDSERTGDESEAALFGMAYHQLEDKITQLIQENVLTSTNISEQVNDLNVCTFVEEYDGSPIYAKICLPEETHELKEKFIEESTHWTSLEHYEKDVYITISPKERFHLFGEKLSSCFTPQLLSTIVQKINKEEQ